MPGVEIRVVNASRRIDTMTSARSWYLDPLVARDVGGRVGRYDQSALLSVVKRNRNRFGLSTTTQPSLRIETELRKKKIKWIRDSYGPLEQLRPLLYPCSLVLEVNVPQLAQISSR